MQAEDLGDHSAFAEELLEIFSRAPLLEGFSQEEIETLCLYMHFVGVRRGARLFVEDEPGDWMVFVLTGEVEVKRRDGEGREHVMATVTAGEVLGEMSLVDGEPRYATCTSLEPADLAVLTREQLRDFSEDHPRLATRLLWMLLQRSTARLRAQGEIVLPLLPMVAS